MKRCSFLSLALAAAVAIGCGKDSRDAGAVGTAGEADRNKVSRVDQDFVHDLAIANMAEVELGRLATERSKNPEVKEFGQLMIDDHSQALTKLKAVASEHNIQVSSDLDDTHRSLKDKLSKLQGADFDREYMEAMADGHDDVVDKLESRVDKAKLAEWKAERVDRLKGTKVKERGEAIAILPEKSANPVTMAINEWAAASYPVVYGHLEAARLLRDAVKKGVPTTTR